MNVHSSLAPAGRSAPSDGEQRPASVVKILEGALRVIANRGANRLSMSDISAASGVSRGTLYRYFSTKEDVLAAVSEFVSLSFETGVCAAADAHDRPLDRFRAAMKFFDEFTNDKSRARVFEFEPVFHLEFFRSHFARHQIAVRTALAVTFDHLDTVLGSPLDRDAVVETLIRIQLSTMIVPADRRFNHIWDSTSDYLESWIIKLAGCAPAIKESKS